MEDLKSIMVGLDLTEMDESVIRYMSMFTKHVKPESIYFVHVLKSNNLPPELAADNDQPIDESLEMAMEKAVEKYAGKDAFSGTKVHYEGLEGSPMDQLLRFSKSKKVKLLAFGRKFKLKGGGIVPQQVARKANASILFIPERKVEGIKHIFIPLDFSKHTELCANLGLEIAKKSGGKITFQHIYETPYGYHKTGKTREEMAQIMRGHAKKDFEEFIGKHDLGGVEVDAIYSLNDDRNMARLIIEDAEKVKADLVISGSKGRTNAAAMLMGSVAEGLVKWDNEIPLIIIKKPNETMGFLDALFKL